MQSLKTTCPRFSSFGVLSVSALQYTVQKHEVFNGPFPQCVRIVKVSWCLERQVFAFELATHSTLKPNMKISATSTLKRGGYIHCSSNKGVTSMPCQAYTAFFNQYRKQNGHLRGQVNIPETTVSPLHFVCLKMIMIIKSSCLHEKQNKQKKKQQFFE